MCRRANQRTNSRNHPTTGNIQPRNENISDRSTINVSTISRPVQPVPRPAPTTIQQNRQRQQQFPVQLQQPRLFYALPRERKVIWPLVIEVDLQQNTLGSRIKPIIRVFTVKMRKAPQTLACSICLCRINKKSNIPKLACNHNFHQQCLKRWARDSSTCPLCRRHMSGKQR